MTTTDIQAAIDHVLRLRGVETPCETCHGMGMRGYPNTATWRRGEAGAATSTKDVCDYCWGTGDDYRRGVDLRKMAEEETARVAERALSLYADKAGVGVGKMHAAAEAVAKELDGLSKTKNKLRPPWFSLVCESLAKSLRDGLDGAKRREAK